MTHGVYVVTGRRAYRGHPTGTEFVAKLEPRAEQRAIVRGDIVLIDRIETRLQPGSYTLPPDWETQ
jgi:hypothetical protein